MPRISGVDIPNEKRLEVALTYIYGIGQAKASQLIATTGLDPNKRAKDLTGSEILKLTNSLTKFTVEGDLKKQIRDSIERLKRIGAYRGIRHQMSLPDRGQRTRTNARTKRGKRITVSALKKENLAKQEQAKK